MLQLASAHAFVKRGKGDQVQDLIEDSIQAAYEAGVLATRESIAKGIANLAKQNQGTGSYEELCAYNRGIQDAIYLIKRASDAD